MPFLSSHFTIILRFREPKPPKKRKTKKYCKYYLLTFFSKEMVEGRKLGIVPHFFLGKTAFGAVFVI